MQLQPVSIRDIGNAEPKSTLDVVGIVIEIGEVSSFTSKAGKDLKKLDIELVDRSDASIKLSVWGNKADELSSQLRMAGSNPVIAVKSCIVGDFGGRSLSSISSSNIIVNPIDVPQAGVLRSWFDQGGGRSGVAQLTAGKGGSEGGGDSRGPVPIEDRVTFSSISSLGLGRNGQQDFCDVKAFVMFVRKDTLWYPACGTEKCNKKMTKSPTDDRWFCEKCNQNFDQPSYRYIATFQIVDSTGSAWCTAFNDSANALFGGYPAQELEQIKRNDEVEFDRIVESSQFKEGIFRLKLKSELYQDQERVKPVIISFKPIDYVNESRELMKGIALLQQRQ